MTTNGRDTRVHGIILAGVHAWGECVLERVCSRPLLPVAGRPLIWYVMQWLRRGGIETASLCANSDTRAFQEYLGYGRCAGMQLDYYEDVMPRGPAGCMRDAGIRTKADTFVVVDGTIVTRVSVDDILREHAGREADLTVAVSKTRLGSRAAGLQPAGIYVATRKALNLVAARGYQDIKEVLIPGLYRAGRRVVPYVVPEGSCLRVTGTASYLAVSGWVAQQTALQADPPAGYRRQSDACVHRSARVASTACLAGPVVVGPDCTIDGGSTIVGPASIGAGCRIGQDVVVRQAAIWSGCRIGDGAIVDDSILVDGAVVEPGAVLRDTVWGAGHPEATRAQEPGNYWALEALDGEPGADAGRAAAGTGAAVGSAGLAG